MSPAEPSRAAAAVEAAERRERTIAATLLAALAGIIAMWPYTSVIQAGSWTLTVVGMIVVVGLTGFITRALVGRHHPRFRAPAALVAQLIAVTLAVTLQFAPTGAVLGLFPTATTLREFGTLAARAFEEVAFGTAPLADTLAVRAMIGTGFAIVAIVLDQLVAARITLLAGLVVAVVGAVPMIVTLGDANIVWFVLLALLILLLLRHSVRHDRAAPRQASAGMVTGLAAAAIVLTLVITPALPVSATWIGLTTSVTLNPTLRLGEDLRRPTASEVLTLATAAETAPYLRIATLSRFDGDVWHPDETDVQALTEGFGEPEWTEQIETSQQRTSIRVIGISSSWLPVPYPATRLQGVTPGWTVMPENRTVVSRTADAAGQDYTVTTEIVSPTLEQIQAATAAGTADEGALPDDLPAVIAATAAEVTAAADTDYDKLLALQSWFRDEFQYSLDTPVDEGFDGTGAEAVARFLDVRSGYCIHFAGAFALMAQTLDMPVRIVVGYLPGSVTDQKRGDEFIYSVASDQLHSWPEVHFEGIGWVPFEPTRSLGVPTAFQPAATDGGTGADPNAPAPSAAPSAAPTTDPEIDPRDREDAGAGADTLRRLDPTPVLLTAGGILLVLLLPGAIRLVLRLVRIGRARRGDALAAWAELEAALIDLRLPASDADTPRARGAQLVERGADAAVVAPLVTAVERESYARVAEEGIDLSGAVAAVIADLRRSVDGGTRARSLFLPRSLVAQRSADRPAERSR